MPDKKWEAFWFEGNSAWGWMFNREEWERVKKEYKDDCRDAKRAQPPYDKPGRPYFGYRAECVGPETLGEWADKNGIIL